MVCYAIPEIDRGTFGPVFVRVSAAFGFIGETMNESTISMQLRRAACQGASSQRLLSGSRPATAPQ